MDNELTQPLKRDLIRMSRTPEVKAMLEYLLNKGENLMYSQNSDVYKGFMIAWYAIKTLQSETITQEE